MHKEDSDPLVSVVVLNYNGKELLERCLSSVLSSDYANYEVIFVDNASRDGSVEYVEDKFGTKNCLKIIRNKENLGFAEGNNVGAKAARGEYMVFLNNDTEVDPLWLKELVYVMESEPNTGVCQSKLVLMSDRRRLDCAGGLLDYYGFPLGRGDLELDRGQYSDVEEIFHAKGAAMAVRSKLFRESGLFESKFFIFYEEIDLCWRIHLMGYNVFFVPESIVFHEGSSSISALKKSSFKVFHATKNHLLMLLKNYSLENLLRYLPIIILFRLSESFLLLAKRNLDLTKAKIRGMFWVLRNLKYIWVERVRVQRYVRHVCDDYIKKRMEKPSVANLYRQFLHLYK